MTDINERLNQYQRYVESSARVQPTPAEASGDRKTISLATQDENGEIMRKYYAYLYANYNDVVERAKEVSRRSQFAGGSQPTSVDSEALRIARLHEFLRKVFDEESQKFMKAVLRRYGKNALKKTIKKYPVPPLIRTRRGVEDGVVSWITIREGKKGYRHIPILKRKLKNAITEAKRLEAEDRELSESLISEIYGNAFKQYRNHNAPIGEQEWLIATTMGDKTEKFFEETYRSLLGLDKDISDLHINDLLYTEAKWIDWRTNEEKHGNGIDLLKARIDELMNAPSWFGEGETMMKAEADYRFAEAEWIKSLLRKLGDAQLIEEYRKSRTKTYDEITKLLQERNMTVEQMIEKTHEDSMLRPRCTVRDVERARASEVLRFHLYAMQDLDRYFKDAEFLKTKGYDVNTLPKEVAFEKLRDARLEKKSPPDEIAKVYNLAYAFRINDRNAVKELKIKLLEGFHDPRVLERIARIEKEIAEKRRKGLDTSREKAELKRLYGSMVRKSYSIHAGQEEASLKKAIGELEAEGLVKAHGGRIELAKGVTIKPNLKPVKLLNSAVWLFDTPFRAEGEKAEVINLDKKSNTIYQGIFKLPFRLPKGAFRIAGKVPAATPLAVALDESGRLRFYRVKKKKAPAQEIRGWDTSSTSVELKELDSKTALLKKEAQPPKVVVKEKPLVVAEVPKRAISNALAKGSMTVAYAKKGIEVYPAGSRKPIAFGEDSIVSRRLPRKQISKRLKLHWATPLAMKKAKTMKLGLGKSYAFIEAETPEGVVRNYTLEKKPEAKGNTLALK